MPRVSGPTSEQSAVNPSCITGSLSVRCCWRPVTAVTAAQHGRAHARRVSRRADIHAGSQGHSWAALASRHLQHDEASTRSGSQTALTYRRRYFPLTMHQQIVYACTRRTRVSPKQPPATTSCSRELMAVRSWRADVKGKGSRGEDKSNEV